MSEDAAEPKLQRVCIPSIGEAFPKIKVKTTMGPISLPDHFAGKWFLLFSHPADFTPVCTTEFSSFAMNHQKFRELNCELIGLSADSLFSHIKWVEWIKEKLDVEITFPIIADSLGEISSMFGTIHPHPDGGAIRACFFVNPKGKIASVLFYPKGVGRNIEELLRVVKALKVVEEHGVVTPANWPENEFIGSDVLERPPTDVKGAMAIKDRSGCLDWWFCRKKI
jgi:peroxiredoxin (alkyl hydroperoxide reductase subunit C)